MIVENRPRVGWSRSTIVPRSRKCASLSTSAVSSTAPHGMPRPANAFITSRLSWLRAQPSMISVRAAEFLARAGGVLKRSSSRKSGRPMICVIAWKVCGLSGGSIM